MAGTSEQQSGPIGWDAASLRDPHRRPDKADRVEAMFDAIAPTYERVNSIASLGRDAVWRRRAVAAAAVQPGDVVLDVCCGTGDMMRVFAAQPAVPGLVVGVDFAAQMLARGTHEPAPLRVHVIRADALRLPLMDESVDVISCAFGVRNFGDLQIGLKEMYRVARAGARLVIIEFAMPEQRLTRWLYRVYCERVLRVLAAAISRESIGAYRYLVRSIRTFETVRSMTHRLEDAGFDEVTARRMNLGGVVLYRGIKRGESRIRACRRSSREGEAFARAKPPGGRSAC